MIPQDTHLRIVPLGDVSGVTKNMFVYEFYHKEQIADIVIVDCGIGFPREKELGVDFVIPDITYLKDKIDKIRAVLLTHGHEDHISALRFHYKGLGEPPVYASRLTACFVEKKFAEDKINVRVNHVQYNTTYSFGSFLVKFIHITHSIPDTTHILITTPAGTFYHGSDYKIDLTPPFGPPPDFHAITQAGKEGVLCLLSDCLGSERPGVTKSESIVGSTFETYVRNTKGRFVMTTFASNISRIRQCAEAAVKYNRKIVFLGRSMRENTKIAKDIGYFPIPDKSIIQDRQCTRYPPSKLCIIAAGSQGQYDSALSKIASNLNPFVKLEKGDCVLFSSDPIPGNEEEINDVIEKLYKKNITVIYPNIQEQLHASGHGNQEDLKLLIRLVNPSYMIPIGGELRHQQQYAKLAVDLGYGRDRVIIPSTGGTVTFKGGKGYISDKVQVKNIYVDAYGVGDVGNIVLRDRKTLSQEGIVFIAVPVTDEGQASGEVSFASRGFIYKTDEKQITDEVNKVIHSILAGKIASSFSRLATEREILTHLEKFFASKTGRKPLIIISLIVV